VPPYGSKISQKTTVMTKMETTQTVFERELYETFTRWLLENRIDKEGEVTAPLVDDFDRRLKAAFADEELQGNLSTVRDFVEGLPVYVQLEQVQMGEIREEYEALSKKDTERTFASYQIPKNEELREKIAALGLSEKESKRVLKANQKQRQKLLGQYFDEKIDTLVATYQRSTDTEQSTDSVIDKIDALAEILDNKYEQKAATAKHRIYEIAEDREIVQHVEKPTPKYQIPRTRKRPISYTTESLEEAREIKAGTIYHEPRKPTRFVVGEERVRQSLERYVPKLYNELYRVQETGTQEVIPEVLRNATPFQKYEIQEPLYFKEPQKGFRLEDAVPTIGLLESLTNKAIEIEVPEAPARSRFIEKEPVGIEVDDATIDRYLARQANESGLVLIKEDEGFVHIKEEDLTYIAPKINPAQKVVDKIRARRAAKEAAAAKEAEANYERPTATALYTPLLTKLVLAMPSSFYETRQPEETGFVLINEDEGFVHIKEEDLTYIAPKINPAQKVVDKIRARRAAKEAAVEEAATYEKLAAAPLYTPKLTELALVMPSSFYIPLPAIVMPEPTVIREANAREEKQKTALAEVYRILNEHTTAVAQRKEAARAEEVVAYGKAGADFFKNYNPDAAEVATMPVVIERVESDDVLENRIRRESRFSQIKGAITAVATVAAAVTALVGGLGYFAKISNDAVSAVYESLKPKISIVETVLEEYGNIVSGEEVKPVYTPEVAPVKKSVETEQRSYTPNKRSYEAPINRERDSAENLGLKSSSQSYDDMKVSLSEIKVDYTPVITGHVDVEVKRPSQTTNELSSETTKEIVKLYKAQQTTTAQYTVQIDPWEMARKRAELEAFKEKRENWESAKALLDQYDAILASTSTYPIQE